MNTLISKKNDIIEIKRKVENLDSSLFHHYNFPNIPIFDDTITIIMTASNRSRQTYFTLETIMKCSFKHIQVIIVDDSDIDPINTTMLDGYPFYIDIISIHRENKNWINPCVNYNIGFKFIKGSKIIIQNAEVCYIGDILGWVSNNIIDNNYYSFDVRAIDSIENNKIIYNIEKLTTNIYLKNEIFKVNDSWYQSRERICNYHFLTAMTRNTFELVKNFSYDYTFGKDWDDNDFLLKIKSKNINIINLFHNLFNFGGIHLYHTSSYSKWENVESNCSIFHYKNNYYNLNKIYIDLLYDNLPVIKKYYITKKTNLIELQKDFLELKYENLHLIFDKKNYTKEMNTFRKCILNGYFYNNSKIKLSKNIKIKILYENI